MTNNLPAPAPDDGGEFLLYQTDDGSTRIEVRMVDETVWLTQKDMAELFQTTKQNISAHLQNVYEEGEIQPEATVKKYLTVQTEGKRQVSRQVEHYNLDAIISVGYRVRSHRGTQFRIWATHQLREYPPCKRPSPNKFSVFRDRKHCNLQGLAVQRPFRFRLRNAFLN